MHVGLLKELNQTPGAVWITCQGDRLDGTNDRRVYLPKSQIEIRRAKDGGFQITIPDWLISANHINWNRISEIEPIHPQRR